MAEQVSIQGLDGLLRSLREAPKAIQGRAVQAGMRKGGNVIRDDARRRAPKESGFMASQIVTRRANSRSRQRAGVGQGGEYFTVGVKTGRRRKYANTKRNRRRGRVGKVYEEAGWAYYWRFVEFGTKKMRASPFLTPAGEAKGPEAAQVIINETWAALDKQLKKGGWR
ncbi:HK97-gp10 family putative phage morphogenesis protein [Stenotrophomonas maltophilia]|uniref:HK97-gp10 family putative phage morphogenesis protein n=1 Tax=Stenotrophomonas maltophilia group sp. Smal13 TaxID=3377166 RepID=UPI001312692D|nr:HK97-gp10 family putative phage morphogenesis protein [Stenotrophomonas maltophilia]EKU9957600.1 HK97 gp10 family phage protein [Stenotrophomonas maltophilia]EKU9984722.1 HK97 gp10 family phage protein [Stenotrophomonas maltophilia]